MHYPETGITATCRSRKEKVAAYQGRHKLLSDDERESLPGDAFEPVAYLNRLFEYLRSAIVPLLVQAGVFIGLYVLL